MSDIINSTINRHLYTAYDGHNLLGKVGKVIITAAPGSMLVAAFSDGGEFLTAAAYDQKNERGDWQQDFVEHVFLNERLLNDASKVTAVFIATDKGLAVPKALYKDEIAGEWLSKVHFIEKDELVSAHTLKEVNYVFAVPAIVKDLLSRYAPKAKIMPFAAHQFDKGFKSGNVLQCTITPNMVFATLNKGKALLWQQVYRYANAEDIAYQLKAACLQHGVDDVISRCAADSSNLQNILDELRAYFPDMQTGGDDVKEENWKATVNLAQQLYACV